MNIVLLRKLWKDISRHISEHRKQRKLIDARNRQTLYDKIVLLSDWYFCVGDRWFCQQSQHWRYQPHVWSTNQGYVNPVNSIEFISVIRYAIGFWLAPFLMLLYQFDPIGCTVERRSVWSMESLQLRNRFERCASWEEKAMEADFPMVSALTMGILIISLESAFLASCRDISRYITQRTSSWVRGCRWSGFVGVESKA